MGAVGEGGEGARAWGEVVAEDVYHQVVEDTTHFDGGEDGDTLLSTKLNHMGDGVHSIMVGDSGESEVFGDEMVDELFGSPVAVAVGSVELEVYGGVGGEEHCIAYCLLLTAYYW